MKLFLVITALVAVTITIPTLDNQAATPKDLAKRQLGCTDCDDGL
jgi:hypothetical protein